MKLIITKVSGAFIISLLVVFLFSNKSLEKAELISYDWRLKNPYTRQDTSTPFVVVGITEDFKRKVGEPFSRKFYTRILRILDDEGASLIGFDIFFPQVNNRETDEEFIKTLKESKKAVLPVFSPTRLKERKGMIYVAPSVRGSSEEFQRVAVSLGHINTLPDEDQVVRKVPVFISSGDRIYPQVSLEMARLYKKQDRGYLEHLGSNKTWPAVTLRRDDSMYIRILPPETMGKYFIPFEDVITGNYPAGIFKNKAVIIGQTIVGEKNADLIPTPWGTQFGVMVQASILHNALSGQYIYRLTPLSTSLLLLLTGVILGMVVFSAGMVANTLLFFGFSGIVGLISFYAMRKYGLFLDIIPFFLLSFTTYFASLVQSLVKSVKKLLRREHSLKIMEDVEKEITEILNPVNLPGITENVSFSSFEGTEIIKQTPEITIRTLMASLGIEAGAFVMLSTPEKYQVIAQGGEIISRVDIKKIVKTGFRMQQPYIANNLPRQNEWGKNVKNLMLLPVISHPTFTVLGIFINKQAAPFSRSPFFSREDVPIVESLALQSIIAIQNARLNLALQETQMETIFRLSVAIEYRDRETGKHIHRVSEYSGIIATNIGLDKNEVDIIKRAMPLHDIGKIAIPDSILLKPGKLTSEERKIIEQHPLTGARMLEGSSSLILQASKIITLTHHEKYDGSGYPFNLKGNSIPLYGRIASTADIFDAMSSKRVYKDATPFEESVEFLKTESGKTFDPKMVEAFIKGLNEIRRIKEVYRDTTD
jgi:HD-GYP domain-containing protein (c-di-GMP phosphodiesterase class II)/CHASE2 domain-containing sensor protein